MSTRLDAIRKEIKQNEEGGYGNDRAWYIDSEALEKNEMEQFKAGVGTNFVRVIPPEDVNEYFGKKIFVHYEVGPNKDAFLCAKMMKGELCPLCEKRDKLIAAEAPKDVIKSLSCFPPRYLFMIVDRTSAETEKKGPQLYDAPQSINDAIIKLSKNRRTGEVCDISDIDNGKLLLFDREGTGPTSTRYLGYELEDDEPIPDDWLDIPTFDEVLKYASIEDIEKAMGASFKERGAEPPEPPPSSSSPTPAAEPRRRRGAEAEAPAAEAPAEAPAAEPAEPAPRRRRGAEAEAPAEPAPAAEAPAPAAEGEPVRRRRRGASAEPANAPAEAPAAEADAPASGDDVSQRVRDRLKKRTGDSE